MALDRRNYRQLVDTTVEIANKVDLRLTFLFGNGGRLIRYSKLSD